MYTMETFRPRGCKTPLDQKAIAVFSSDQGKPKTDSFLDEHLKIGFGKPSGILLKDGTLMTYFWCTSDGITHTRWARLRY
jgi:uncharacterized protein YabE (DUF348 family)